MRTWTLLLTIGALILVGSPSLAANLPCLATASAQSFLEGQNTPCSEDLSGNTRVTQGTTTAGEDVANDVQKVEERFLTIPAGGTTARISADQLYKTGPGHLRSITCNSDATATAGTIAVLDGTSAGVGNVLYQLNVEAVAYTQPFTVPLYTPFSVGLYLDFTTTADMFCTLVYR